MTYLILHRKYQKQSCLFQMSGVFQTTVSMAATVPKHGMDLAATVMGLDTLELPVIPVSAYTYQSRKKF